VAKRQSKKRSTGKVKKNPKEQGVSLAGFVPLISAVALFVIVVLAIVGLEWLKDYVYALPEYNPPVKVELANAPDWVDKEQWRPRILSSIHLPKDCRWLDGELIKEVADQMMASGWVSKVNWASQEMDGTIRLECEYRRPIAMVLVNDVFIPVDCDGVRLPEVYDSVDEDLGWICVCGVKCDIPDIGKTFVEDDAVAAVKLASLIFNQGPKLSNHISRIDVSNFRGRVNKRDGHIVLLDRHGNKIIWGSAVGEEIEENTIHQKIGLIMGFFEKGLRGRYIDVSTYPDRCRDLTPRVVQAMHGSRS